MHEGRGGAVGVGDVEDGEGDAGVVEEGAEGVGAGAYGEEGDGVAGVVDGGPAYACVLVEDGEGVDGEGGEAVVEGVLRVVDAVNEGVAIGLLEALPLGRGELYGGAEAEVVGEELLHFGP